MEKKIRKIVIVGGGTAGWMVAAALAKTLGTHHHDITLVESEMIGTVGVGEATIPQIALYNSVVGLDEAEMMRETNATFKLGIEFRDWRKHGHSYFHPFGFYGVDMGGISFSHYWLRWKKAGGNLDYTKFNVETEAARDEKFLRTSDDNNIYMPQVNYAYQFDASLYAKYLRMLSEKRGVRRMEGKIVDSAQNAETGYIESVKLESGQSIEGDFFIDCSGFRGLLIEQVYKAGYHDWSSMLPVNKAVAVPCEKNGPPLPYTRATAREAGWQWRIPLQHRTGNGYVFSGEFISEDEATARLMSSLDGEPLADPKVLKFTTGVRKKSWVKNVVAVGLSNGFLEPLESTSIHLIQVAIAKILAMFPGDQIQTGLVDQYNEEMHWEYDHVKDFLIAHYHVTERDDTPFWNYVRTMEIPAELKRRLETFRNRGETLCHKSELFKEVSWFAVLYGQGLEPTGYHPVANSISEDDLKLRLAKIRSGIQDRLNGMPSHQEFIDRYCAAKSLMSA